MEEEREVVIITPAGMRCQMARKTEPVTTAVRFPSAVPVLALGCAAIRGEKERRKEKLVLPIYLV